MMGPFPPPHNVQHSQTPPVGESKCLSDRQEESRSVLECQARWAVDLDSERLAIKREGNKTPNRAPLRMLPGSPPMRVGQRKKENAG